MITIKAIFENGDSLITRINATAQEAREYYIGKYFNLGTVGDDMQRCIAVEIITD